jgi:predicted dehydrogenase
VLCEKPLCISPEEAKEILALPRAKEQICGMVFNNRWLSATMRAKELIESGRLGRILSFHAEYLHSSATDTKKAAGWKQDREICGGGVLFDLGSHVIDLMTFLCGRFARVGGMSQIAYPTRAGRNGQAWETNADEAFYMLCRLRSGAVGTITVSKLVHGANDDLSFAIYGEKGSLKFSLMQPNFLYFYDATTPPETLGGNTGYRAIECVGRYPAPGGFFPAPKAPSDWLRGHVGSMYSFLRSVDTGVQAHPDFADGAHVQAVMEAAYRSAESGKEEHV